MAAFIFIYSYAFFPAIGLLALAAYRWGDAIERTAIWSVMATVYLQRALYLLGLVSYGKLDLLVAALDLAVLVLYGRLSILRPANWLIVATALLAVGNLGHIAALLQFPMTPLAYAIMAAMAIYPLLLTLSIGLWLTVRTKQPGSRMP